MARAALAPLQAVAPGALGPGALAVPWLPLLHQGVAVFCSLVGVLSIWGGRVGLVLVPCHVFGKRDQNGEGREGCRVRQGGGAFC